MVQKCLVLCKNVEFARGVLGVLRSCETDVAHMEDSPKDLRVEMLNGRYDILIIDKQFCGTARRTAELVIRIRKAFLKPIIAFSLVPKGGDLLTLQVAGCNFNLDLAKWDEIEASFQIAYAVNTISTELEMFYPVPFTEPSLA